MSDNPFDQRHVTRRKAFVHKGLAGSYCETGDPKGYPLIILHGLTGNHIGMLPIAAHLKKFRCILPNVPGHGATPIPPPGTKLQDITAWFKAFVTLWDKPLIITHSYGGSLAMAALTLEPQLVAGCILMNPVAETSRVAQGYRYLGTILPPAIGSILNDAEAIKKRRREYLLVRHEPSVHQRFEQLDVAESVLHTSGEQFAYFRALGIYFDVPAIFANVPKELAKKTYCIVASRDPIVSDENNAILQAKFGKTHVIVCPQSGHLMPIETTSDAIKIINKVLKRLPVLVTQPTPII